ncbi:MAG: ABC transporter substrate-binding protein [Planctomycetota bacterium]|jgi:NitT/TauT family transport system substrate-binding protein|nr:ABC transporter substrate-binding protein [Planctomycetota bacterium]
MSNRVRGICLVGLGLVFLAAGRLAARAEELRVGRGQGASTIPMLAKDSGYFADEGLNPDLIPFISSADGLNALNAGKIDVGLDFGTCAPLTYVVAGADFVIIAGTLSGGHPIIAKKENAGIYEKIEGFRGKTAGTPRLYTSDIVWRGALKREGLEVGRDVGVIEFKRPPDVVEAVRSGKIDVGIVSSGQVGAINKSPDLSIVLWSNDLFPDHPCCRIVTTREVLKNRRPELVKLIKALLRAEEKFTADPEAGVTAVKNQLGLDDALTRSLVLEPHSKLAVDPNTKAVVEMWNYMIDIDYINSDIDPRGLIDVSLYRQALAELAREHPSPFWDKLEVRFREWNE